MSIPDGGSEELIGEAMGAKRKPGMLIATKARFPMGEGPNDRGLSRWHLIRECEASLKRLRTDVIDLYQVHQWDGLTPLEETMEALDSLVRAGKVRYVGCSNWSGWHMMKAMEVARRDGRIPFVSEQIHYTLAGARSRIRTHSHRHRPEARRLWCGARSPAGCSAASIGATKTAGRHAPDGWLERAAGPRRERAMGDRRRTGRDRRSAQGLGGADRARVAARRPAVTSLIIGGRTEAQFRDNLACVNVKLTDDERARLDKVSLPPLIYPYWHQSLAANDRFGPADLALHAPYLKDG